MSPPRKIGPFEIVKKLGGGTTASTYLAMEHVGEAGARILVCLKVPHHRLVLDRQFRQVLLREARIAATLHHPNIVQLERVERYEGLPCLVLDFIEGMDLAELIAAVNADGAQLDWLLVVYIALSIARALEHAHEDQRGLGRAHERPPVIHRDLAPSNILLGLTSGAVYVTDFGLALAMDRAWILGSGQQGRIAYAAPEYLLGRRCDVRADFYSLGVILFEALTGRRPFPANAMHERNHHLAQVFGGPRPSLHGLRFELHPSYGAAPPDGLLALAAIVDRLLEPNPAKRFQTAAELVAKLGAIAIPSTMDWELRDVVQRYQPAERRSIRATTGEHPVANDWSSTGMRHVEHLDGKGRAGDGLRVSAEGAARLIAAFAHERERDIDDSLENVVAVLEGDDDSLVTDLDPDLPWGATDPDLPAFDTPPLEWPTPPLKWPTPPLEWPIGGAADPIPIIPTTRPSQDPLPIIPATRPTQPVAATATSSASPATFDAPVALASSAGLGPPAHAMAQTQIGAWTERAPAAPLPAEPPPASGTWIAAQPSTPPSGSFAETHYRLAALDPSAIPRRTSSAPILAAAAVLLALVSLFCVSTASSLLAPLMTGQLGYHIIDGFWTPLFTYGGLAGFVLAFVLGAIAVIVWWKGQAKRRGLARR